MMNYMRASQKLTQVLFALILNKALLKPTKN